MDTKKIVDNIKHSDKPDSEFDTKQLELGIRVEMEHTTDKEVAKAIAKGHLMENPKYYDYLIDMENKMDKDIKKKDMMIEINPDGGQQIVEGKEPLKKDPKKRWNMLKAEVNASEAFLPMLDNEEDEEEPIQEQPEDDNNYEGDIDRLKEILSEEGYAPEEINFIAHNVPPQQILQQQQQSQEEDEQDNDDENVDDVQAEEVNQQQQEEHSKRMSDLEYDFAKRKAELELKFLEEQYKMKLAGQKQKIKKSEDAVADDHQEDISDTSDINNSDKPVVDAKEKTMALVINDAKFDKIKKKYKERKLKKSREFPDEISEDHTGWISPKGEFHKLPADGDLHNVHILKQYGYPDMTNDKYVNTEDPILWKKYDAAVRQAHKDGWIGVSHEMSNAFSAHENTLKKPNSPAMLKFREVLKDYPHFKGGMSIHGEEPGTGIHTEKLQGFDIGHFAKHGTLKAHPGEEY